MEEKELMTMEGGDTKNIYLPTIWNNQELGEIASRSAKCLAGSDLVPAQFKGNSSNCLIALDIANRLGMPPMTVMQNLYVVQGKPGWSGQMCIAIINNSKYFTPLDFKFVGEVGADSHGCYAYAKRLDNGSECVSDIITIKMAKQEGWYGKSGSKWQTMPIQMMKYRAGAFFARTYCPELLIGLPLADEVTDISKASTKSLKDELSDILAGDNNADD